MKIFKFYLDGTCVKNLFLNFFGTLVQYIGILLLEISGITH
jgi:hypothetical protein